MSTLAPSHVIILRGERFTLSETQLRTDSPNWFTGHFLSNSYPDVLYADRKPDLFRKIILEHLSGYDVFPVKGLAGLSDEDAAKAVLAEAEFFKLKKLAARAKEELGQTRPSLFWPYKKPQEGEFFPIVNVQPFLHNLKPGDTFSGDLLHQASNLTRYRFTNLQLRITPQSINETVPRAATLQAVFLNPLDRTVVKTLAGRELIDVAYWDSGTQQASVSVDGAAVSLEILLQWAARPSPNLSKVRALQPLTDIFHPELVPRERLLVTLLVHSAIGYWSQAKLRLVHLNIRSRDQGYAHLDKP